jgi:hypothetical protein
MARRRPPDCASHLFVEFAIEFVIEFATDFFAA